MDSSSDPGSNVQSKRLGLNKSKAERSNLKVMVSLYLGYRGVILLGNLDGQRTTEGTNSTVLFIYKTMLMVG